MKFARRLAAKLFPRGIDAKLYESHASTTVPPLSGSCDGKRSEGGVLGTDIDHSSFLDVVFGHAAAPTDDYRAELTVVQSAGKPRPLTKQPSDALCLRPLHKAFYDSLSRRRWLHRGDVTFESLRRAGFSAPRPGEVLTSGDYKSATDGLSIEVAEAVLSEVLDRSDSVPDSIKAYALRSLRPNLFSLVENIDFQATRGQQMGSYLSFPLLCLQNYIAFRYAAEQFGLDWRRVPVSINGDDILFLSTRSFSSQWMEWTSSLGLEVEITKTSVSADYGSLNSTLVVPFSGSLVVVPTVRFGMLGPVGEQDLATVYRDFVRGLREPLRFRAAHVFFRTHISLLRSSSFTTWELGFRGRLAERMTERFRLTTGGEWMLRPLSLPQRFISHSVTLSSDSVEWVDSASLSKEEEGWAAREIAAWRFSCPWSRARHGLITFHVMLAMARPTAPVFDWCRVALTPVDRVGEWRRWMRTPPEKAVKRTPVPWGLYEEILRDRPPPPYSEFDGGLEVATGGDDKKGKAFGH